MSNRGLPLRSLAGSNVGRMPPPVECRLACPSRPDDATRAAPLRSSHPPIRKPSLTPRPGLALAACHMPAGGDGGALCRRPLQPSWQYCRRPRLPPSTATAYRSGRRMTPADHKEWRIHDGRALNRGSAGGKPAAPIWRHGPVDSDAGLALLAGSASQQTDRRRLGQSQRLSA